MQENKEFEHWKRSSFLGMEIINDYSDLGYTELTDVQVQEIYEAGQKSERDKHRWILVTERLPNRKDGKVYTEHGDTMIDVIVYDINAEIYTCPYNLRKNDWECKCDGHVKWQPLPEA